MLERVKTKMKKKSNKIELKIELADTNLKKLRGLMFRKKFSHALVFLLNKKTRVGASIHSFLVFFPFDIIWLDEDKIIDLKEKVKPFTFNITPKKPSNVFIELPAGTIKKAGLKKGMKIKHNKEYLKL